MFFFLLVQIFPGNAIQPDLKTSFTPTTVVTDVAPSASKNHMLVTINEESRSKEHANNDVNDETERQNDGKSSNCVNNSSKTADMSLNNSSMDKKGLNHDDANKGPNDEPKSLSATSDFERAPRMMSVPADSFDGDKTDLSDLDEDGKDIPRDAERSNDSGGGQNDPDDQSDMQNHSETQKHPKPEPKT